MDLKLFGKKISLSLVISLATLAIVLFTCCSCCHSDNVVEAMTGKKRKEGFKEKHDNIHNTQTKMPGTIVNVAQPAPIQTVSPTVPQHTHQQPIQQVPQTSEQLPFNLNIHLKDKKMVIQQLLKHQKQQHQHQELKLLQLKDFPL